MLATRDAQHREASQSSESAKEYICKKPVETENGIKLHIIRTPRDVPQHEASQSSQSPNECHVCKRIFETERGVRVHVLSMHKQNLFKCTEKMCQESFALNSDLKSHELSHSSNDRPYPCDDCEKCYKTKKYLRLHISLIHKGYIKRFKCDICHAKFAYESKLKNHEVCHSKVRPYECDICEKNFKDKNGIHQHMIQVHNEKRFKCDLCHRSFSVKYRLKEHKPFHTGERLHPCNKCHKRFKSKKTLREHIKLLHEEKPFQCVVCQKKFKSENEQLVHELLHLSEKRLLSEKYLSSWNSVLT